jgi:hypothetical protein
MRRQKSIYLENINKENGTSLIKKLSVKEVLAEKLTFLMAVLGSSKIFYSPSLSQSITFPKTRGIQL